MKLSFTEARSAAEIAAHASAWEDLLASSPQTRVDAPSWIRSFFLHKLSPAEKPLVLFAWRGPALAGVFPLLEGRTGLVRSYYAPRNPFHTTGVDAVVAPGDGLLIGAFLWHLARTRVCFPVIRLRDLPGHSPAAQVLSSGGRLPRGTLRRSGGENVIDLTGGFEALKSRLDGHFLRELRRRERKLGELGEVHYLHREKACPTVENLRTFARLEDSGWKGEGGTSILRIPGDWEFFAEALPGLAARGWLEWHFLHVGDRAIAGQLVLRAGRRLSILKIGFDVEFSRFAPGNLLLLRILENACAQGDTDLVDFLALCDWHRDWGVREEPLFDATLFASPAWSG